MCIRDRAGAVRRVALFRLNKDADQEGVLPPENGEDEDAEFLFEPVAVAGNPNRDGDGLEGLEHDCGARTHGGPYVIDFQQSVYIAGVLHIMHSVTEGAGRTPGLFL